MEAEPPGGYPDYIKHARSVIDPELATMLDLCGLFAEMIAVRQEKIASFHGASHYIDVVVPDEILALEGLRAILSCPSDDRIAPRDTSWPPVDS